MNQTSSEPPTPAITASIEPFASMMIWVGAAAFGSAGVKGFPAVSKTTLQPSSMSLFGPRESPAGWQNFTGISFSRTPLVLITPTAPLAVIPSTSGMEM